MSTKKSTKNDSIATATSLVADELGGIFDRCDEEIDELREEIRGDNAEEIRSVDWSQVTAEDILKHPEMRGLVLAHIQNVIEHFTYMNDDE
jgi:hypothetical protein